MTARFLVLAISGIAVSAAAVLYLATTPEQVQAEQPVLVFAAASTTNAMSDIIERYEAQNKSDSSGDIVAVFDATSRAARQVSQGAPAHVLISANSTWVDWLIACGQGDAKSRRIIASNRLVVIAPDSTSATEEFTSDLQALRAGRFAVADPAGVPAGIYARQSLEAIDVWEGISSQLLRGDNVRTVLAWVATGAADAGIVYESDALVSSDVGIAANIPNDLHDPIIYEALAVKGVPQEALTFLDYLSTHEAGQTFASHGFSPPHVPLGSEITPDTNAEAALMSCDQGRN